MTRYVVAAVFALALSHVATAAEGITVRFKVEEQRPTPGGAISTTSYENAYLFGFGEAVVADFKDIAKLGFTAKDQGPAALLKVSLHDYVAGAAAFIGEKELAVKFNEPSTVTWSTEGGVKYVLHLLPTRAPLPN